MMVPALRLRRDIACQQAVELVTAYLEGTLARAGRRRFEAHLAGCPHCTEYLAQMRKTIELTGSLTPDDLTPQMAPRANVRPLTTRSANSCKQEGQPFRLPQPHPVDTLTSPITARAR